MPAAPRAKWDPALGSSLALADWLGAEDPEAAAVTPVDEGAAVVVALLLLSL